ncbi:unnamed protein product [Enterobius vermicularis]|uniref:ML domain-containing protein n=1 Tax=Enterobius vermicularis TaxID=51028 RepID=A0A0N4V9G6_ENTVE|nr:unnamed protein product [Enterobius vermicularis]
MYRYLAFALLIQIAVGCDFPNGTETALHWWDCGDGTVKLYGVTPLDENGNYVYPIKLDQPVYVAADIDNTVKEFTESDQLFIDISIWQYGGWLGCKWTEVPTFGTTSNLAACTNGVNCPVPTGKQTVQVTLDFTVHKQIVNLLKNDAPYQLEYRVTDKSTGKYACAALQARAYTK